MNKSTIFIPLIEACKKANGSFSSFSVFCINNPLKFFSKKGLENNYNNLSKEQKEYFNSKQKFFDLLVLEGYKTSDSNCVKNIHSKCIICNEKTEFISISAGYRITCSKNCFNLLNSRRKKEEFQKRTPEQEIERKKKEKNTKNKRTQKEKDEIQKRKSESMKITMKNRTIEEIKERKIKQSKENKRRFKEKVNDYSNLHNLAFIIEKFSDNKNKIDVLALCKYFNISRSYYDKKLKYALKKLGYGNITKEYKWALLMSKLLSKKLVLNSDFNKNPEKYNKKDILIIHYKVNIEEHPLACQKSYISDLYDPIENIWYEFDGDYFHGNPDIGMNNQKFFGKTFNERFERTLLKRKILKEKGFKVFYIWEKDFHFTSFNLSDLYEA